MSGVDVGRLEVEDKDLPGSPNWAARFTILEGDPDGHFAIRTDPKTNEGVLSVVKVRATTPPAPAPMQGASPHPLGSRALCASSGESGGRGWSQRTGNV